jgi:hypothetical protein
VTLFSWHKFADVSVEPVAFVFSVHGVARRVVWFGKCRNDDCRRAVWIGDPRDLFSWPRVVMNCEVLSVLVQGGSSPRSLPG